LHLNGNEARNRQKWPPVTETGISLTRALENVERENEENIIVG
jgi:hypothetical protein